MSLSSCRPAATAEPAQEPIRLATYFWPGSYWIDVAWDQGWFADAGLNVERVNVDHKYFASMNDVAAGSLQGMGFSQYDLLRYVAAGHELTGIIAMDYSEGAEALVARPGINTIRDLRGKKVALHRGTYLEYLLSIVVQREAMDLDQLVLVDHSGDDAMADFHAGKVDAVLVWEPYVSQAKAVGGVELFSTASFPGLTYSVFTLRRDFIESHPREVKALVGIWHRANHYLREHERAACEIVDRLYNEPPGSAHDLLTSVHVLDVADNGRAFSYAAGFESLHGSWRRMNDFMLDRDLIDRRVDSPSYLDSRFIRVLK